MGLSIATFALLIIGEYVQFPTSTFKRFARNTQMEQRGRINNFPSSVAMMGL